LCDVLVTLCDVLANVTQISCLETPEQAHRSVVDESKQQVAVRKDAQFYTHRQSKDLGCEPVKS
jgi:hypothetical protein